MGGDHVFGNSYYKSLHGCIARTLYEHRAGAGEDDSGEDAAYGTAMHGWLASYHGGRMPSTLEDTPVDRSCSLAALASRYQKRFPASSLGQAVLMEQRLRMPVVGQGVTPDWEWEEPFAGTLDLITDIDAGTATLIAEVRGVVLDPGLYLVDHKTKKRKSSSLGPQYMVDPQFTGYWHLYHHNFPAEPPLTGILVNILFRYMEDPEDNSQFLLLKLEPPTAQLTREFQSFVRTGAERRRLLGDGHKDATRCFEWNRECPCYASCDRCNL